MFRLSTIRRLRRAQQRAPAPRTSSRSTSGRAGRASLETAGGCQCCPYTRTDRYHRVSVQQQHGRAAAAPAPGITVGTSLLTDGGFLTKANGVLNAQGAEGLNIPSQLSRLCP